MRDRISDFWSVSDGIWTCKGKNFWITDHILTSLQAVLPPPQLGPLDQRQVDSESQGDPPHPSWDGTFDLEWRAPSQIFFERLKLSYFREKKSLHRSRPRSPTGWVLEEWIPGQDVFRKKEALNNRPYFIVPSSSSVSFGAFLAPPPGGVPQGTQGQVDPETFGSTLSPSGVPCPPPPVGSLDHGWVGDNPTPPAWDVKRKPAPGGHGR